VAGVFPFGRPALEQPPRPARSHSADVFVLGVYPSALHVRWRSPGGEVVGALAVDDEPEVFWDGSDQHEQVMRWARSVGWSPAWGAIAPAGNGTSGRSVTDRVLGPLGTEPARAHFTDCVRTYFVKHGPRTQGARVKQVYEPMARARGLPFASLPPRPSPAAMVRLALEQDRGFLADELRRSDADTVVTLGQEAADVFASVVGHARVELRPIESYGQARTVRLGRGALCWFPLVHPGQRMPHWRSAHDAWVQSLRQ
jgi:hypothetical protein